MPEFAHIIDVLVIALGDWLSRYMDDMGEVMIITLVGASIIVARYVLKRNDWKVRWEWPFPILVPLEQAALKVYDLNRKLPHAHYIELLSGDLTHGQDGRLNFLAEKIAQDSILYGLHLPGTQIEVVDRKNITDVVNNGKSAANDEGRIVYDNLMIDLRTFRKFAASIRVVKS